MSNFESISSRMIGRIAMLPAEAVLVEKYAKRCKTWLEIGTLWGGSCLLVALANPSLKVICVDPMIGYYGEKDKDANMTPSIEAFYENLRRFDVVERVTLLQQESSPFPDVFADCIFIDGAHDYDSVKHDMQSACEHAKRYILCHDTNDENILRAIQDGITPQWKESASSDCMKIYRKASEKWVTPS